MANDLTIGQIGTIVNSIIAEATGKSSTIGVVDATSFVTAGQTALKVGTDPLLGAIGTVLSKTVFKNRPYSRKFKGLEATEQRYGIATRKLYVTDKDWGNDDRLPLTDGQSVDQQIVRKPVVLQLNFYGQQMYSPAPLTIFRDQLDTAFRSASEFAQFISMLTSNVSDNIEQVHENLARATIANFINAKVASDDASVIHLLTEYNTQTGLSLTPTSVYAPDNFSDFMQWAYSRISQISDLMTERTYNYHLNITGKEVRNHTPKSSQRMFVYSPLRHQMEARVLSNTFHEGYLGNVPGETVNFWQNPDDPMKISSKPVIMNADGTLTNSAAATTTDNVMGVLFDEMAMGYTVVNQWNANAPFNARGGYTNMFWHFTDAHWNNFVENGVVFLLD
jgi:hypothetical protein